MVRIYITDVLNGDGGLTDNWIGDRLINDTKKRIFCRMSANVEKN
jgi:hypothetical protein